MFFEKKYIDKKSPRQNHLFYTKNTQDELTKYKEGFIKIKSPLRRRLSKKTKNKTIATN